MLKRRFKTVHPSPESTLTLEDQECFLCFHCMNVNTSLSKFMNKLSGRQPSPVPGIRKVFIKNAADDDPTTWYSKLFDFLKQA